MEIKSSLMYLYCAICIVHYNVLKRLDHRARVVYGKLKACRPLGRMPLVFNTPLRACDLTLLDHDVHLFI